MSIFAFKLSTKNALPDISSSKALVYFFSFFQSRLLQAGHITGSSILGAQLCPHLRQVNFSISLLIRFYNHLLAFSRFLYKANILQGSIIQKTISGIP